MGAIALTRLAYHVTTPQSEGNGGIIVHSEVISLWIHPALLDLAQRPADLDACWSLNGFRQLAQERGLEKAWYVFTVKGLQVNGETIVLTTIRRPYDLLEAEYSEFSAILAIAAGNAPPYPFAGLAGVEARIVPGRFRAADPRAILDELRMLERRAP
jgi:hypothetical protein